MAKQTFTTGQVLTAAQMTSLQQTAMGGGSATAKTASYVLVAADAGATVIMNSASATTITVNTSLFSAGDTVFIQNIGAGVSTITAGTATVNTAASLALAQYDSGSLYFTAAGTSIFNKSDGAAAGGGGKVLQVVQGTTTTNVNVASMSFTDTGLSATITPTLATSKILIMFNQSSAFNRSNEAQGASLQLLKGASVVYSQDGAGGGFNSFFMEINTLGAPKGVASYFYANGIFLDSPATTSATTYKTQGRCVDTSNSGQVRFQPNAATSTITLMEIGA